MIEKIKRKLVTQLAEEDLDTDDHIYLLEKVTNLKDLWHFMDTVWMIEEWDQEVIFFYTLDLISGNQSFERIGKERSPQYQKAHNNVKDRL